MSKKDTKTTIDIWHKDGKTDNNIAEVYRDGKLADTAGKYEHIAITFTKVEDNEVNVSKLLKEHKKIMSHAKKQCDKNPPQEIEIVSTIDNLLNENTEATGSECGTKGGYMWHSKDCVFNKKNIE